MFDIGFWEIVLISVIGLIVLGPERLPIAIRNVIRWINTARNMANAVKAEISHELQLHEINEQHNKSDNQELSDTAPEQNQSINEIKEVADTAEKKQTTAKQTLKNQQDKADEYR
jgi:sec-independent protein translocase protein TatB